ncbi:hypothetical protein ACGGZK_00290 [Agromyces sp. MMS24-K17]|uniref:hypothetical protein n=1 Tax=Agromyces sp. MMS24-K17 TaxID=3372850 RepID=UPI0037546EF1
MDVVSWVVLAAVIVLAAVGVGLWNRFVRRSAPVDRLDADAAKGIREVQSDVDRGPGLGSGRTEL